MATEDINTLGMKSLNAAYMEVPGTDWRAMLDDGSLIMSTVVEQLRTMADGLSESDDCVDLESLAIALHGTLYLAEMARGVLNNGHSRALKESVQPINRSNQSR